MKWYAIHFIILSSFYSGVTGKQNKLLGTEFIVNKEIMKIDLPCFLCGMFYFSHAYKFLVSFSFPVRSLNILGEGVVRHLINAGHEVTYITVYPLKNQKNLRQIDVSQNLELFSGDKMLNMGYMLENRDVQSDITYLQDLTLEAALSTFQNKDVKHLLEDTTEKFDVVIVDYLETEIYSAFAVLYACPMIWVYSMGAHWVPLRLIDGPAHPAYSMDYLTPHIPPFTFAQRVEQLWNQVKWTVIKEFRTIPKEEAAYKKIFGPLLAKRAKQLPNYRELIYNASFIFSNEHYAVGNIPATPPNFKFIGGCHVETPTKSLPLNLQKLMDNARHGVIYFSMGSAWQSKDIPSHVIQDLLRMFGELKQTVIWKYEEKLPNVPSNVHIVHWAPQQSILAHHNLLFFITHGGHLSSTEALHFGVPIIGVPIYFDQFININKAVMKGYALTAELSFNLADNLRKPIQKLLKDTSYREKAKQLSAIYHDRQVSPGAELVHWVEHVVHTGGAPHLQSPALRVPFYQKLYLDLLGLILASLALIYIALKKLISFMKGSKTQVASRKKKN